MNVNHPAVRAARAALLNAAIVGALALAACSVAGLAFEFENMWTLSGSLIAAAICGFLAAHNVRIARLCLKGSR
jgi:hypothetical protein